jgi:hypothetical protein
VKQLQYHAVNCSNILQMMPPFCQALLEGIKYGFMATILTKKKVITMEEIITYTKGKQIGSKTKTTSVSRMSFRRQCF